MDKIKPGLVGEKAVEVTESLTARHLGSGGVLVFSTPSMVALMEGAAVAAIEPLLDPGTGSVGTVINVQHLAATPVGQQVRARAEVTGVDGRQIHFTIQAWDNQELIGEATHTRFVIDFDRFMRRVEAKNAPK